MKIAVVPDIHLNATVYSGVMDRKHTQIPFRNIDFMKAFKYAVDKCINELFPDLFVIPGDTYDKCHHPSDTIRGFFSAQLSRLTAAQIPIIILVGNHDVSKKNHALQDIQELKLKNIVVVNKPTITVFEGIQLFLFPYSMDVEQQKKTIKEDFMEFVKEIHAKKDNKPSIFFGHFGVRGASVNQHGEDEDDDIFTDTTSTSPGEYKNRNPNDIDCDDLDSIGADYVFLGDYHKHQILNTKKCIAMYPGSLEKTSFNQIDQDKGFIFYNSEAEDRGKMGRCRFIEYPNCRPMLELKGNFMDMKEQFKKIDCNEYQDAIVKLKFTGFPFELVDYSAGSETFKKEIREKINPIYIDFVNKAKDDKQKEEVTKLEQDIMENGRLSNDDVKEVVKELAKEQIKDEKELALTLVLSDEIYQETVGK